MQVVQSIMLKLGGVVMIFMIFVMIYSCIGVHLLMLPYDIIGDVNIRSALINVPYPGSVVLRGCPQLRNALSSEILYVVACRGKTCYGSNASTCRLHTKLPLL